MTVLANSTLFQCYNTHGHSTAYIGIERVAVKFILHNKSFNEVGYLNQKREARAPHFAVLAMCHHSRYDS